MEPLEKEKAAPGHEPSAVEPEPKMRQESGNVQPAAPGQPFSILVFRPLILDRRRISHGAFRLWHYLRDRMNESCKCWPTQRDIASDIGCKPHSLKEWTCQLVSAGYLAVEAYGPHHNFRYTILGGDGHAVLPDWASRRVAEKGITNGEPRCPFRQTALPKSASRRVAQKGNLSNLNGVNSTSKGESAPLSISERISLERELERITAELSHMGTRADYANGSSKQKRFDELTAKRTTLRVKLRVVA